MFHIPLILDHVSNGFFRIFFHSCDAIFLNYCWKEASLQRSVEFLASQKPRTKAQVFVGVDVFGRGCFGGGKFNCNLALSVIKKYKLSVAMFAPGWTYQNLGRENFELNDYKYISMHNLLIL